MGGDDRRPARDEDYRQARIYAAGALAAVLIALLLWDAFSEAYEIKAEIVGLLIGGILGLLGRELVQLFRGGPRE